MLASRLAVFSLAWTALLATGCRRSIVGHYEYDREETKKAVELSVAEHPEQAQNKSGVLQMLSAMEIDLALEEGGQTTVNMRASRPPAAPIEQKRTGTWVLTDKKLAITIPVESRPNVTTCDVDGTRLRCHDPQLSDLMSRYVLVRK